MSGVGPSQGFKPMLLPDNTWRADPALRSLLDAVASELERLDAPERDCALDLARTATAQEGEAAERGARRLAFSLAQAWMGGLLGQAGIGVMPRGSGLPPR